jgi:hypothetical protein
MRASIRLLGAAILLAAAIGADAQAQPAAESAPAGHWVGSLDVGPGLAIEIDLGRQGTAGWRGTMSVPAQGSKGVPLADVTVKNTTVEFAVKGAPGDPRYSGVLSADGKTITGTFTQGGGALPLVLTWKGEAQFAAPVKNKPISPALAGTWEGTLDVKGTMLRLVLTLANGPDGATGNLVSLDQNNFEIPVSTVTEEGSRVKLALPMISGAFDGEVKGAEIAGTWSQGPMSLPLVFKKRP